MNKHFYLTIDQTNAARAESLANRFALALEVAEPRDLPRLERQGAKLVLDWDFLPQDYQDRLLNGTGADVVAVHGYNLPDALVSFLPRRGILCSRTLDEQLFEALARPASAA